jgi:peptidyl-prolyl cis-trans isomerase SurA
MKTFVCLTAALMALSAMSAPFTIAQKTGKNVKPSDADIVLVTVGKENITYGELERAFQKNMSRRATRFAEIPRDSVMDFIELYTRYRLKVQDAFDRKFDQDSAVKTDIGNNRRMLSETYYFDKKVVDPTVGKLLERRKRELQAQIMVFLFQKSDKGDTTRAYNRAKSCFNLVKNGRDFAQVAKDSSEDTETGRKGGMLPFFTSARVLREVEDAAYSSKVGELYPSLVKTRVGYFVVKLVKNEPRLKVRASHILFSTNAKMDSVTASQKADSVLALLKKGASFEQMAKENSNDPSTAQKGGYMGAYYTRSEGLESIKETVVPEFERALFALKDGTFSDKVWTDFGCHIIRRDSTIIPDVEKERDFVKKEYKRLFFQSDKERHLDSVRKAFGYTLNTQSFASLLRTIDTTKTASDTTWSKNVGTALRALPLYATPSMKYSVGAITDSLRSRKDLRGTFLNTAGIKNVIYKMFDQPVIEKMTSGLENEYSDFAILMKEFRDGIMLFKVEENEVWSKLKFDSTQARQFWEPKKNSYNTDLSYDITEIYVTNDSLAKSLRKRIDAGEVIGDVAKEFTERRTLKDKKGALGLVSTKTNKLAKAILEQFNPNKNGTIVGPMAHDKGWVIASVNDIQQPRVKTFQEAIPDFAPAFQDMTQKRLTEEWIKRLKSKFKVALNQKNLDKIIKK